MIVNVASVSVACAVLVYAIVSHHGFVSSRDVSAVIDAVQAEPPAPPPPPTLDRAEYDGRLLALALSEPYGTPHPAATSTASTTSASSTPAKKPLWPAKAPYPEYGALLPFHRIVAYYGNFYSTQMGVLGEYPHDQVLAKLKGEVASWNAADPATPALPAVDYIAVTAQGSAGKDGKYRLRMPDDQVDKALAMAREVHGVLILDIQVGLSTLPQELPLLENYLKQPDVHLAIDPEFSMVKSGVAPGHVIGTFDAADVNYAANYLAELVRANHLPPKVLVVHRFTEDMVTGYKRIKPLPEVQVVMDMDGWGFPERKKNTYRRVIQSEPVQFTGFKLFYKNDIKPPSTHMLTPREVLQLTPRPVFIQYQ